VSANVFGLPNFAGNRALQRAPEAQLHHTELQPPSSSFSGHDWRRGSRSRVCLDVPHVVHPSASFGSPWNIADDHRLAAASPEPRQKPSTLVSPSLLELRPSDLDPVIRIDSLKRRGIIKSEPFRSLKILRLLLEIRTNRYRRITERHVPARGLKQIQIRNFRSEFSWILHKSYLLIHWSKNCE
jgi:hypothetical protein